MNDPTACVTSATIFCSLYDIAADTRNSADAPRSMRPTIAAPSAACARKNARSREAGAVSAGEDAVPATSATDACFPATTAATASDSR